jgi:hypothetical protein
MATDRFGAARSGPGARSRARYRLVDGAARAWKWLHTLYQVFLLVRFSVLLGIVGGLVLVLNGQAQDVVRALGEDPDRRVLWLIAAALASAGVAWWSARIMFYFRFRNPASAPTVFPTLKEHLPRVLGASALALVAIALLRASFSYDGWFAGPAGRLVGLALLLLLLAAGFVSTNSCTAGNASASAAVSPADPAGTGSGDRRCSRSPSIRSGSRLVTRI